MQRPRQVHEQVFGRIGDLVGRHGDAEANARLQHRCQANRIVVGQAGHLADHAPGQRAVPGPGHRPGGDRRRVGVRPGEPSAVGRRQQLGQRSPRHGGQRRVGQLDRRFGGQVERPSLGNGINVAQAGQLVGIQLDARLRGPDRHTEAKRAAMRHRPDERCAGHTVGRLGHQRAGRHLPGRTLARRGGLVDHGELIDQFVGHLDEVHGTRKSLGDQRRPTIDRQEAILHLHVVDPALIPQRPGCCDDRQTNRVRTIDLDLDRHPGSPWRARPGGSSVTHDQLVGPHTDPCVSHR